jgi:phage gp36-like protein
MPWITLTPDHLLEALGVAEIAALSSQQTASGQADPVPEILARTCAEVQGYVATRHPVGQPGTVPDQLLTAAIALARWRLLCRLPVKALATEGRRQEYLDAVRQLEAVAAGKFRLSVPEDPAEEQPGQAGGAWGGPKEF